MSCSLTSLLHKFLALTSPKMRASRALPGGHDGNCTLARKKKERKKKKRKKCTPEIFHLRC